MQITEKREFYRLQAIVSAATVNQDNINIEFNGLSLYSEDEDKIVEINKRRTIFEVERCSEGIKIDLFILNEGDSPEERIDYLIDEDYEIETFNFKVTNKKTGKELQTRFNELIGEQVMKEVPIELEEELQESLDYILGSLTEGNFSLKEEIYKTLSQDTDLQKNILNIMELAL